MSAQPVVSSPPVVVSHREITGWVHTADGDLTVQWRTPDGCSHCAVWDNISPVLPWQTIGAVEATRTGGLPGDRPPVGPGFLGLGMQYVCRVVRRAAQWVRL